LIRRDQAFTAASAVPFAFFTLAVTLAPFLMRPVPASLAQVANQARRVLSAKQNFLASDESRFSPFGIEQFVQGAFA
jgi:hypothetical protein